VLAARLKCGPGERARRKPHQHTADRKREDLIEDALDHGIVVIGAAGNGGRQPVTAPARYACAVTALGRRGTFPPGSLEEGQFAAPAGTSPEDFLAKFSNHGEVDFTAPGLGVVSTIPGGHRPDQGTSMAAAAVTGMTARLLSAHPAILEMPRDRERSIAMLKMLTASARPMGLGFEHEGYGMLL
jgi:subtilisin